MSGRNAWAEIASTYTMVLIGCGAIAMEVQYGGLSHLGVALAWGAAVGIMIHATGHLSGAHMNPAVTLMFAVTGRHPWPKVAPYVLAQLVGATLAGLTLRLFFDQDIGTPVLTDVDALGGMWLEILMTAILVFVILGSTHENAPHVLVAPSIGGTVFLMAFLGGPLTRAAMNPARAFGPAFAQGDLVSPLAYLVGPVLGALLGAAVFLALSRTPKPEA